jgi:hypothetical protein
VVWWSEFLATDPEVRVRFVALPEFLISCGSETRSSLVSTIEEPLGRNSSGSSIENEEYSREDEYR